MIQEWVFAGVQAKDNESFWRELSVSGMSTSEDKKTIEGMIVGGKLVTRAMAAGFVRDNLRRALAMEAVASGKKAKLKGVDAAAKKERTRILRDLHGRYGKPGK